MDVPEARRLHRLLPASTRGVGAYSPNVVEQEFSEVRGSKVAETATRRRGRRPYQTGLAGGHDPRAEISGIWKSVASRHCMRTDGHALKASYSPKCVE